jgi:V/A-type H+-transporting ATPase subunit E
MAEEIKNLIEKIQQEGVQIAEEKAREIENQTRQKADEILGKAKKDAQDLIAEAKEKIAKTEDASKSSLKQTARDLILSLKKELNAMLNKLILSKVKETLTPEEMAKIITALIKDHKGKNKEEIIISLKKEDLHKLEKGLLSELSDEIKKGITLKPSDEISNGFIISFDAGKSHFDFSDEALAEYIGLYLKPKLAELLKEK